jgi:NAD(P)-dependent dehydrogenase (short-subunit alcohol dehydrogenase family)
MQTDAAATPGRSAPRPSSRVALVTGGARRLGREIALALARDGWDVGVHFGESRDDAAATAQAIVSLGRRAVPVQARLENEADVLALLPAVIAELGPVSCLINNASRFVYDDTDTVDFESIQAHLLPNLAAPVLLARELLRLLPPPDPQLPPGPQGVVVNLLDQKLYGYNPDFLSYTLSKAALAAANAMLAQALAPRLRVVGVAPGLTLPSYLQDDRQFKHAHRAHAPLGRASTLEDVVGSVLFAVSNQSLTGSVILCDGGQHLRPLPRDISLLE